MNSQTRIIVIRLKETIITAVIVLAIIILLLMLILSFTNGGKDSAVAANTSNTSSSYIPGVYTSSITLGGNPIEVQVSLDENHINDIQLHYSLTQLITQSTKQNKISSGLCNIHSSKLQTSIIYEYFLRISFWNTLTSTGLPK